MADGDDAPFRKDFKLELSKFRTKTKPTLVEGSGIAHGVGRPSEVEGCG